MKILIKVTLFCLLAIYSCAQTKPNRYTDLDDYGFSGKIKTIHSRFFFDPEQQQNKWEARDTSMPAYSISFDFNGNGNYTKKTVVDAQAPHQLIYIYSGAVKTGCKKIDKEGRTDETGTITWQGDNSFEETTYDMKGKKTYYSKYILGANFHSKTMEDIGYNNDGSKSMHLITTYQEDKDGHLHSLTRVDKLKKTTTNFEYIVLEKDSYNNPIKILAKKGGKPYLLRLITITYE